MVHTARQVLEGILHTYPSRSYTLSTLTALTFLTSRSLLHVTHQIDILFRVIHRDAREDVRSTSLRLLSQMIPNTGPIYDYRVSELIPYLDHEESHPLIVRSALMAIHSISYHAPMQLLQSTNLGDSSEIWGILPNLESECFSLTRIGNRLLCVSILLRLAHVTLRLNNNVESRESQISISNLKTEGRSSEFSVPLRLLLLILEDRFGSILPTSRVFASKWNIPLSR